PDDQQGSVLAPASCRGAKTEQVGPGEAGQASQAKTEELPAPEWAATGVARRGHGFSSWGSLPMREAVHKESPCPILHCPALKRRKKMSRPFTLAALTAVLFLVLAAPARAADDYKLDPMHAAVTFKISHLGLSWTHGRFNDIAGEFTIDSDAGKCSFS